MTITKQNIFSIQNVGIRKIITILGIKFKFKSQKLIVKNKIAELETNLNKCQNLINEQNNKLKFFLPKFSVIMPTYNRAFCIENAINSLLNQTYQEYELIIIDDGSTDNTEELIKTKYATQIQNQTIIYKKLDKNFGASHARNVGLSIANNDWIAYLDTDNTIRPYFIATYAKYICLYDNFTYYAQFKRDDGLCLNREFDHEQLKKGNYIDMGVFVHNKALVNKYGNFNEQIQCLEDWDLILRYTKENEPIYIKKVVLDYNCSQEFNRMSHNVENLKKAEDYIMNIPCEN